MKSRPPPYLDWDLKKSELVQPCVRPQLYWYLVWHVLQEQDAEDFPPGNCAGQSAGWAAQRGRLSCFPLHLQARQVGFLSGRRTFIESGFGFIESGSGSSYLGWIPIRVQDLDDQKLKEMYSWKKVWYFYDKKIAIFLSLGLSIKDVQAKGEAFSPKKGTSSTSKHEILELFPNFVGHFCPPGSGSVSAVVMCSGIVWLYRSPTPAGRGGIISFPMSITTCYLNCNYEGRI